jgi:hypothetical protein
MMAAMDVSVAWRAALLFAVSLAVVAVALALALSHQFFEDWGWLAGPAAWAACALFAGALLKLPLLQVLIGAALSALPSLAAVAADQHWAATPLGIVLFGASCGWIAQRRKAVA